MAIPDYQSLMLPLMRIVADEREHSIAEVLETLAAQFALDDHERAQTTPSGRQALLYNRMNWARTYLKHAGLIESTGRSRVRITRLGQEALAEAPPRIDNKFLRRFPSFVEFQTASRKRDHQGRADEPVSEEPLAPPTGLPTPSSGLPTRAELEAAVLTVLAGSSDGMEAAAILDAVPAQFPALTPAALEQRTQDGRNQQLRYDAMWARQFLEWRGLIRPVRWRFHQITEQGAALVAGARRPDGSVDVQALAGMFPAPPRKPRDLGDDEGDGHMGAEQSSSAPGAAAEVGPDPPLDAPANGPTLSFVDAAERILAGFGGGKSMHYREITKLALETGLVRSAGLTPEQTLYAQVLSAIAKAERRGQTPRFVKHGRGLISLSRVAPPGLAQQIEQHNREVSRQLHERLLAMTPARFEVLVSQLLGQLGFENIVVTGRSGDGGIDVRGTLVVGEVIRTRMAVQVKRWRANNVQAPTVQQVRGSLGTHDQGLIITTSDFSAGGRTEAQRPNAVPVALMNGAQLISLLVEHQMGVRRSPHDLIELDESGEADG